jgi:hypothetical protein
MTPLFACFPVCLTFVAIGIIGVIALLCGLTNRLPEDDAPPPEPVTTAGSGPPPLWVLPLMLLVLTVVMLVLGWYWPE